MRLALPALLALAFAASAAAQADRFFITGIESKHGTIEAGRGYGVENESTFATDANGDGDLTDNIVRVFDPATQVVTTLPFAVRMPSNGLVPIAAGGDFEVFGFFEEQHFDLDRNGDGDEVDDVLCIRRVSTGAVTVVPLAIEPDTIDVASDGSIAKFKVNEIEHGVDLNGNGYPNDNLHVALDPASAAWWMIGTTSFSANGTAAFAMTGGGVLLVQSEFQTVPYVDLNGDGDVADFVPRYFDLASTTTTTFPFAVSPLGQLFLLPGDQHFIWTVREQDSGATDWNGDGDAGDYVPMLCERATLALTSLGVHDLGLGSNQITADRVLLLTDDAANNKDFNGDGDLLDSAILIYEIATATMTTIDSTGMQFSPPPMLGDGFFAFEEWEIQQTPPTDLNGDGDHWDRIAGAYVIATGEKLDIPVSLQTPYAVVRVVGTHVFLIADETYNNATNLNYDNSVADRCAFAYDVPERRLSNLARSIETQYLPLFGNDARVPFMIVEALENGQSANGDGDTLDQVPAVFDPTTESLFEAGIATKPGFITNGGNTLFWVDETAHGVDVDGDSKLAQYVLAMYAPEPQGCGAFAMYGAGCPTSAGRLPELEAHGCAEPGGKVRMQLRGGVPGQNAFLLAGLQQASVPLPGDCTLWTSPVLPLVIGPYFLPLNGLLGGATLIEAPVPANALPGTLRMQMFVTDALLPKGYAASNGLEVTIAP